MTPPSLCRTCVSVRLVEGKRGQIYLFCRNETIPEKYPPQPVVSCSGYAASETASPPARGE